MTEIGLHTLTATLQPNAPGEGMLLRLSGTILRGIGIEADPAKNGADQNADFVELPEEFPEGRLVTRVECRQQESTMTATIGLAVEGEGGELLDATRGACAAAARTLHDIDRGREETEWVTSSCNSLMGTEGGEALADLIRDGSRDDPIFVMPAHRGLTPEVKARVCAGVGGGATVVVIDGPAYDLLGERLGMRISFKRGGCLFLPEWDPTGERCRHRRFHVGEMWSCGGTATQRADRILGLVRPHLGPSPCMPSRPQESAAGEESGGHSEPRPDNTDAQRKLRKEINDLKSQAGSVLAMFDKFQGNCTRIVRELAEENEVLRKQADKRLRDQRKDADKSRREIAWLKSELTLRRKGPARPSPKLREPTALDVVGWAAKELAPHLVFGKAAFEAAAEVEQGECSPHKLYSYLAKLREHAQAGRVGTDTDTIRWLRQRGCDVSGESETTQNECDRTWPVAGKRVRFDLHMKPSQSTRVYFRWDPEGGRYLVGWVGRHLPTSSIH